MNKIKKIGNITIFNDEYVLKEERDMNDLEHYFMSRDFHNYLPVIERVGNKNKYPYLESYNINNDQLVLDIAKSIGLLHNKTSYFKEVSIDKKKSIYDDIIGYINYTEERFKDLLSNIEYNEFPSPSEMIFLENYTKFNDVINFVKRETENWFNIAKDNTKERIALVHGNVSIDHAISNDKLYLINWNYSRFESPVIDLKTFYLNTWDKVDFSEILNEYFRICPMNEEEKKLFFITISIPKIVEFKSNELENVHNIRYIVDYIYKTERLIGPYYTVQNKEE